MKISVGSFFGLLVFASSAFAAPSISALSEYADQVQPECPMILDMVFLQDFSDSFTADRETIADQLELLLNIVSATLPDSRTGFGTFVDKPLLDFGYPYQGSWFEGDWCYNLSLPLGHGLSGQDAVDSVFSAPPGGGNDWAENVLGALYDVTKSNNDMNWSTGTFDIQGRRQVRVVVVSTDAPYHIAGDGFNSSHNLPAHAGGESTNCTGEDYPTITMVREALWERDIYTVFLIGEDPEEDVYGTYQELLELLKHDESQLLPGAVYNLSSDSSNLLEKLIEVYVDLADRVCDSAVDIAFAQDVTYSYNNDMPHFQAIAGDVMDNLAAIYNDSRFGLTTFGDKPLMPLGHGDSGDYCYRLEEPMNFDRTVIAASFAALDHTSGVDWRESQLDGLISTCLDPAMDWRAGGYWMGRPLLRIAVLATDAGWHRAPDALNNGHTLIAHNGGLMTNALCTRMEYPTVVQLADALKLCDVNPIFVVTNDMFNLYGTLKTKLALEGVDSEVVRMQDFNIKSSLSDAVRRLSYDVLTRRQRVL